MLIVIRLFLTGLQLRDFEIYGCKTKMAIFKIGLNEKNVSIWVKRKRYL